MHRQQEPNFYDDLGEDFDPQHIEKMKRAGEAEGNKLDYLIHRVFAQSDEGVELLSIWRDSLIMAPTAEGGMDMVEIGTREGMKRMIRGIILTIKRVEEK